jgi:hypothetical protein
MAKDTTPHPDQDHGRARAKQAVADAGYPDKVPTSGGKPVHLGPNRINASKPPSDPLAVPTTTDIGK